MHRAEIFHTHALKEFPRQPWEVDKNFVFTDMKTDSEKHEESKGQIPIKMAE